MNEPATGEVPAENKDEIITEAHEYFDDVHYVWMRVPSFWVGDFVATHSHKIKLFTK